MDVCENTYPLSDPQWLLDNEQQLKRLFGNTFTPIDQNFYVRVGFNLKLLGLEWFSENQFATIMAFLQKLGVIVLHNKRVKATDKSFNELFEHHYAALRAESLIT